MEDRDLLQANVSMIAGTLLFIPFKENLIESNLRSCIINKRIVIALPIAAGIAVLAYIFSFQVGAYAAFPAIVAIAILGYAVSKPAWLIVERSLPQITEELPYWQSLTQIASITPALWKLYAKPKKCIWHALRRRI
jgi:hypothetical protein